MTNNTDSSNGKYRWHVTVAVAVAFALVGFIMGWSIGTKHPNDRLADALIITFAFLTLGLLAGYVTALLIYKRFRWFDALASFAIPALLFVGYIFGKSGDWSNARMLGIAALVLLVFVVFRFIFTSHKPVKSQMSAR